jgi:hypothetical protein
MFVDSPCCHFLRKMSLQKRNSLIFLFLFAGIVLIDNVTRSSIHSLLKTREEKEEHIYRGSYKTIQSSLFIFFVDICHGIAVIFPFCLVKWDIFK